MIQPIWQFELVRDTNAPLKLVRDMLLNGQTYHLWHPRHRKVQPEIVEDGECLEISYNVRGLLVHEDVRYRVEPDHGRLLLTYRNRFKGWPVILLMGWWRIRSEHIWERLISSISSSA